MKTNMTKGTLFMVSVCLLVIGVGVPYVLALALFAVNDHQCPLPGYARMKYMLKPQHKNGVLHPFAVAVEEATYLTNDAWHALDAVVVVQKALLLVCFICLPTPVSQLILAAIVSLGFLLLFVRYPPYREMSGSTVSVNRLEKAAGLAFLLSVILTVASASVSNDAARSVLAGTILVLQLSTMLLLGSSIARKWFAPRLVKAQGKRYVAELHNVDKQSLLEDVDRIKGWETDNHDDDDDVNNNGANNDVNATGANNGADNEDGITLLLPGRRWSELQEQLLLDGTADRVHSIMGLITRLGSANTGDGQPNMRQLNLVMGEAVHLCHRTARLAAEDEQLWHRVQDRDRAAHIARLRINLTQFARAMQAARLKLYSVHDVREFRVVVRFVQLDDMPAVPPDLRDEKRELVVHKKHERQHGRRMRDRDYFDEIDMSDEENDYGFL